MRLRAQRRPQPYRPAPALAAEFERLLSEELQEGIVREISEKEVRWVNPTFLVPKGRTGKYRKILDCRALNREIAPTHFKMETPDTICRLARKGDWATSLDVKSAFNHVPVHPSLRPYLAFAFENRFYTYYGMPFGIQHAPRVFTMLMRRAVRTARERWNVRIVAYMDDLLLLFEDALTAELQTRQVAGFLQSLGWTLALDKCEMTPTQTITFLGWRWDLSRAEVTMPPGRRTDTIALIQAWMEHAHHRRQRPVRELAALIGSLSFLRLQFGDASLHLRTLDALKAQAVKKGGWTALCTANPSVVGELKWWLHSLTLNTPAPTERLPIGVEMTTDASPSGWGAVLAVSGETLHTFGSWHTQRSVLTSNAKELTAVTRSIRHFTRHGLLQDRTGLLILSDNTSVVADINRLSASGTLTQPLLDLVAEAKRHGLQLQAKHIPGTTNEVADRLSRMGRTREYYLKEEYLRDALRRLELQPNRDVFGASPYLEVEVGPAGLMDAFRTDWSRGCLFLHPPPHLLTRTVAKALAEEATAALVAPAWKGAVWSPILAQMTRKEVVLGTFDEVMQPTPRFLREGWRLPPGNVVVVSLAGKMTRERPSSPGF
jgi:hypothetical protein